MVLKRNFYSRSTVKVAQDLLGCFLIRKIGKKVVKAAITETEAYHGEDDLACHASRGRTPRTETMYGRAGYAYVYLIYGMYHCLNVVTAKKNFPGAVLIRGVKIEGVDCKETNGPGKLCRELKINRGLNGWDLTKKEKLWIEKPKRKISSENIKKSKRIGIDYAGKCKDYLWRFEVDKN